MRSPDSRRKSSEEEEKVPESGERKRAKRGESGKEQEPTMSAGDRFELDADRYNDIRDSISEKRSELKNLKLNSLTKGDTAAAKALEDETETLEAQAIVIEKSYGAQANQFATDASRQKNIRTEMDLATRKTSAIERVMKRGEFPGGDEAAKAEMDAQHTRISRATLELEALKSMYKDAEVQAAPAKPERKPKAAAKEKKWMSSTGTRKTASGKKEESSDFDQKETEDAVKMALDMSADSARRQEDAEYTEVQDADIVKEEDDTIEIQDSDFIEKPRAFDQKETEDAMAASKKMSEDLLQTEPIPLTEGPKSEPFPLERRAAEPIPLTQRAAEPIPLLTKEQKETMALDKELAAGFGDADAIARGNRNERAGAERSEEDKEVARLEKELEFHRGAVVREEHNLIDNFKVSDPIAAVAERSKKGALSRFFSGLSAKNRALDAFDQASNKYANTLGRLNELKNRREDPDAFRAARQVGNERR